MLKEGLYISENHENALDAYTIKMHVKETEKSYIFTLIDFESRYSAAHIEMLFKNSKRFVLRKNRGRHALRIWGDDDFTFYPYQAGIPYCFKMIEDPKENQEADKMRVVIYARNACLNRKAADSQRRQLERYAEENNYEVAAAITLDGIPGNDNENMMEYLLNVAKRKGVDTVLTCDKSCISRDVPELLKIVQQFRENGIRFEYFDFNINTVSILPSFIGYLLFLSAINYLCDEERELNLLRTLVTILTVWHIASWLASWGTIDLDGMFQVVDIIIGVVNIYFHFQLLTNLASIATKYQSADDELDTKLLRYRTLQTVMLTAVIIVGYLAKWLPELVTVASIGMIIIYLIVGILLMKALFDLRRSISSDSDSYSDDEDTDVNTEEI